MQYAQTITCPCTTISIKHRSFLHINYTQHQVCSSRLVNNWIEYFKEVRGVFGALDDDFRYWGSYIFTALEALCKQSKINIINSLSHFYDSQYVHIDLTPEKLFQKRIEALLNLFVSSTKDQHLFSLDVVRQMIYANALFTVPETNAQVIIKPVYEFLFFEEMKYGNCTCYDYSSCTMQSSLTHHHNFMSTNYIRGLYRGCYIFEGLLVSTLECFYDENCFQNITSFISIEWPFNETVMDTSVPSRFSVNSTVNEIVENLMVENWTWSIAYEKYFNECRPIKCTYTHTTRNDAIYIVTTVIGLTGGLITVLELIVPRLVRILRYLIQKRKIPETNTVKSEQPVNDHVEDEKPET